MSPRTNRSFAVVLLIAGMVLMPVAVLGQNAAKSRKPARAAASRMPSSSSANGLPSTTNGEWPYYTADLRGSRYSPLDQINGENFNKLEVAWRFKTDSLGTRPEYKLEGTPIVINGMLYATAGTRRSVVALKADTGELVWVHAEFEGQRAVNAPRQLSGRGLSYWTDGKGDDRSLYVTTG